ncbi:hypothetical protein [Roseibium sp.]|uniref:hypothetical protein n=1 Tax=Roseibium sp. TaxID=1936156 RepID=UPI003BAFA07C
MDALAQALLNLDEFELANVARAIQEMVIDEDGTRHKTSYVAEALIEWANEVESDFGI